jgi:pimeloyl-ACP methyl ester carboxylesterase
MFTLTLRYSLVSLALGVILASNGAALAQPGSEDLRLLPYAEAGQLVDIGSRRINLRCSGSGSPTVVLAAGSGSWSTVWYKTQPEIAKRTRVCAFDRASYGFSDPARPQTVSEVSDDLHAALKGAQIPGPYVLVGHSLGGLEVRLYAQRWPDEVAGMILVDTSPAGEMLIEAGLPGVDDALSLERMIPFSLACGLLAARAQPTSADFQVCMLPLPGDAPAALRKVWPTFFTLDRFMQHASLLTSLATHRHDGADKLDLGDKPMVVLSLDLCCLGNSPQDNFWRNYKDQWYAQHAALARMSLRGVHRVVDGAGHSIMVDKPEAVISAVDEVLGQLRAGT